METCLRQSREFGEAVIVVDQEPSKLSDSIKANTYRADKSRPGRLLLIGERSLRRAIHEFVGHYHSERNHQGPGTG